MSDMDESSERERQSIVRRMLELLEPARLRVELTMRLRHKADCAWFDEEHDRACDCGALDAALGRTP